MKQKERQEAKFRREVSERQEAIDRLARERGFKPKSPREKQSQDISKNEFIDLELEKEWIRSFRENRGNVNKTFRLLSLKYHPDRNSTKTNWAHEKQKQLGLIKEYFTNNKNK